MQELTEITCAKNIQHENAKAEVTALMVRKRRAEWFLARAEKTWAKFKAMFS